ncbi:MAG: hypothetical protein ABSC05_28610 [Candidatus Solibacter sp.]
MIVFVVLALLLAIGGFIAFTSRGNSVPSPISSSAPPPTPIPIPTPIPTLEWPVDSPTMNPTGYVQALNAQVSTFNFFVAGAVAPAKNERVYGTRFRTEAGRFILWELNLQHGQRGSRQAFTIVTYLYGPDDALKDQAKSSSFVEADWVNSSYFNRLTALDSTLSPGNYSVSIFIDGVKVAANGFVIERDEADIQRMVTTELEAAQQLYTQREYKAAVAACDRALHTDPGNVEAGVLRTRILKTIEILGIQ